MYNERTQSKHQFQYKPLIANFTEAINKEYSNVNNYQEPMKVGIQPVMQQAPVYKLGYEFESGNHVNAYVDIKPAHIKKHIIREHEKPQVASLAHQQLGYQTFDKPVENVK